MGKPLNVLFVCSGSHPSGITPFIKAQAVSLQKKGIQIEFFTIKGKGLLGYLKSIPALRKEIRKTNPDVVHGHYSLSCFVASLASSKPVVASLMGSDSEEFPALFRLVRFMSDRRWKSTIIKSESMNRRLKLKKMQIVPNGVDFEVFRPMDQQSCKKKVGFDPAKAQVLFMADPARKVKNLELAMQGFDLVDKAHPGKYEFKLVCNIPHDQVAVYLNAADVVLLTSRWEGSPNIIKEAMACNIPIVSTDVGDVRDVITGTEGCYLTDPDPLNVSAQLIRAFELKARTTGRENISHLDSGLIAEKLIRIYEHAAS